MDGIGVDVGGASAAPACGEGGALERAMCSMGALPTSDGDASAGAGILGCVAAANAGGCGRGGATDPGAAGSVGAGQGRHAAGRSRSAVPESSATALWREMSCSTCGSARRVPQLKTPFNNTTAPSPAVTAVVPLIRNMLPLSCAVVCCAVATTRASALARNLSCVFSAGSQAPAVLAPIEALCGDSATWAWPAPQELQLAMPGRRVRRCRGCAHLGTAITTAQRLWPKRCSGWS